MFQAIEKEAKTASGYASLHSVFSSPAQKKDEMPRYVLPCIMTVATLLNPTPTLSSFFTAET